MPQPRQCLWELFMRPLKTKHLNNFLVKIFASWGGDGCGWGRGWNGKTTRRSECSWMWCTIKLVCQAYVCGCVCVCARHAKTSRNLPVIQLAQPTLVPPPLSSTLSLSIEIELYCSFLEQRRAKAMANAAFGLPGKLLSPSCFPLWEFSIVWQFTFYLFAFLFACCLRVCVRVCV